MPASSNKVDRRSHGTKSRTECTHARIVDYEYSKDGEKTGNLICIECGAIFFEENERPSSVD
jgi:hypothetical protein